MHTAAGHLDIHERTHRSLRGLLDHCAGFSEEELSREFEGFGYPSIRRHLHHMIGAEQYWVGVLRDLMLTEEVEADVESMEALRAFHDRVAEATTAYLRSASDAELSTARTMTTWGDKQVELVPAHVLLRTQTHIYDHKGQIAVMARRLGRPIPAGLDFPLR